MGKTALAGVLLCAGFASGAQAGGERPLTCDELGAYTREIVLLIELGAKPHDLSEAFRTMDRRKVPFEKSDLLRQLAQHLSDVTPVKQDNGDKLKIVKFTADLYQAKCNEEIGR